MTIVPFESPPAPVKTARQRLAHWWAGMEAARHEQGVDLDQAFVRIVIAFCLLPWWYIESWIYSTGIAWSAVVINLMFIAFSVGIYMHIEKRGEARVSTRVICMIVDQGTVSAALIIIGTHASPLFFIYIWVAVGNALRFGIAYSAFSTALAIAGFLAVCVTNGDWGSNTQIVISWGLAIALIPTYVAFLARRIELSQSSLKRRAEEMRHAALHDVLTGLYNRAGLEDQLAGQIALAAPASLQWPTDALVFIDLDGFKEVNDENGHAVGDMLLRKVAVVLSARLRSTDVIARLGGDEFAALLCRVHSLRDLEQVTHHIVHDIAGLKTAGGRKINVSASVGVAVIGPGDTMAGVLKRADESMYRAKKAGKNRYVIADLPRQLTRPGL